MQLLKHSLVAMALAGIVLTSSCKKNSSDDDNGGSTEPTLADKIKDSTLAYSRDIYLWYDQIPSTFDTKSYADPNELMVALRKYSKETGFTDPVDRWSFAIKQTEWDDISSGIAGDFGLNVFFRQEGDLRVRFVEAASPAGRAGVRRGWRITKLNNNTNITTSNSNAIVSAVYESASTSFEFTKPDGSTTTVTLNAGTYQENPVYLDSVYTVSGKKVGYLVFNSFLGDTSQIANDFARVFSRFSSENVTDVVIDLRYNGGGYVNLQEKLANYLVQSSKTGQVMMNEVYNNNYRQWNETINFRKLGSLNVSKLYFIVSSNTASASELLINNMKPHAEVRVVGPSKSYGKPVGYFPIPVSDWYIFPVSSRTTNASGSGNYFGGITTDATAADGLDKDWGNTAETSLASVLSYISSGNFAPNSTIRTGGVTIQDIPENKLFSDRSFKGSILPAKH
ncbi:MAG: S41 family peptidase [Flavitalea sp.]